MVATPDVSDDPGPADEPARRDARSGRPAGRRRVLLTCIGSCLWLAAVLLVLAIEPWLGALAATAAFVVFVPLGSRTASTRLVVAVVLGCGLLSVALALGEEIGYRVLTTDGLAIAFGVVAAVAAGAVVMPAVRGRRPATAHLDLGLVAPCLVLAAGWLATGLPAVGVDLGDRVGGLMALGWDHQSHFSIFGYLYEQGGVWRSGDPESASMFIGYPPLAGALEVGWTLLVAPDGMGPVRAHPYYVQASALLFGLGAALVAWTAGSVARSITVMGSHRDRAGSVALVSGLVVGGYIMMGPASSLFDHGFVNFFFAVGLGAAASWASLAKLRGHLVPATVAISAAAALAQLWTPLVVLMVPAGLVVVVRQVRGHAWSSLGATVVLSVVAGWSAVWQVLRIVPTGAEATSIAATLAGIGGGHPAVPIPHLAVLVLVGLLGMILTRPSLGTPWMSALVAPLAGAVAVGVFIVNTARADIPVAQSYYVAKAWWIVYVALLPVAGAAVAATALVLLGRTEPSLERLGGRARVATAGMLAAVLAWSSTPTPNAPNGLLDYYSLPVGGQAAIDRWHIFREVPQGDVVERAQEVSRRWPDRLAIAWDSGDLLTNRWLASLRGDLDGQANNVYTALAGAPYGEPARDALSGALAADPDLTVVVVWSTPETRALIRPLRRQFPHRVALGRA